MGTSFSTGVSWQDLWAATAATELPRVSNTDKRGTAQSVTYLFRRQPLKNPDSLSCAQRESWKHDYSGFCLLARATVSPCTITSSTTTTTSNVTRSSSLTTIITTTSSITISSGITTCQITTISSITTSRIKTNQQDDQKINKGINRANGKMFKLIIFILWFWVETDEFKLPAWLVNLIP